MAINLLRVGSPGMRKVLILRTRMKNLIIIERKSRDAGGQLTSNTVNRYSQMLGIGKKTFRVSSMTKLFSSLTIQESMGILTEKRTFVEWLRLCNHSIILVRKKGGLSKALKVLHRSMESAFQKNSKNASCNI